jgi:uncharacterized protein YukE
MPIAHADPERLRDFAQKLKEFAEEIDDYTSSVRGGLSRLGETWRDEHFHDFKDVFDEVSMFLRELSEEARTVAPYLERDADIIDRRRPVSR